MDPMVGNQMVPLEGGTSMRHKARETPPDDTGMTPARAAPQRQALRATIDSLGSEDLLVVTATDGGCEQDRLAPEGSTQGGEEGQEPLLMEDPPAGACGDPRRDSEARKGPAGLSWGQGAGAQDFLRTRWEAWQGGENTGEAWQWVENGVQGRPHDNQEVQARGNGGQEGGEAGRARPSGQGGE